MRHFTGATRGSSGRFGVRGATTGCGRQPRFCMFAEICLWKCEAFDANGSLRASLRTHNRVAVSISVAICSRDVVRNLRRPVRRSPIAPSGSGGIAGRARDGSSWDAWIQRPTKQELSTSAPARGWQIGQASVNCRGTSLPDLGVDSGGISMSFGATTWHRMTERTAASRQLGRRCRRSAPGPTSAVKRICHLTPTARSSLGLKVNNLLSTEAFQSVKFA